MSVIKQYLVRVVSQYLTNKNKELLTLHPPSFGLPTQLYSESIQLEDDTNGKFYLVVLVRVGAYDPAALVYYPIPQPLVIEDQDTLEELADVIERSIPSNIYQAVDMDLPVIGKVVSTNYLSNNYMRVVLELQTVRI